MKHDFEVSGDNESKVSQATQLVNLLEQYPVFHDQEGRVFIIIKVGAHSENWDISSRKFEEWLSHRYFQVYQRTVSKSSISDAITTLRGKAIHDGVQAQTYLRAAKMGEGYCIDLGDTQWSSIHIEPGHWSIQQQTSALFYRADYMQPLPAPTTKGTLDPLWDCLNIPERDRLLLITFLLECYRPETNYPLLVLLGDQGSAKSTTQQRLKQLMDPSAMELRVAPKQEKDLFIAASNDLVLSYNNLSYISPEQQDAMCCLSTGGTYTPRMLYSNNQELVLKIQRPMVINGIDALITRQDLLERTICIDLPVIEETARRTDRDLDSYFERHRPAIHGALLNIFCKALDLLPSIPSEDLARMADFTLLGRAVAVTLGHESAYFDEVYKDNQRRALEKGLETCPVYPELVRLLREEPQGFHGNYADLLRRLERNMMSRPENWPKSSKKIAAILKRQKAALRKVGIMVAYDSTRYENGYRVIIDRID